MTMHPPTAPVLDDGRSWPPYSFSVAFELGWDAFKRCYGGLLLSVFVYGLISVAVSVMTSLVDQQLMGTPDPVIQPVTTLADWLFLGPLTIGFIYVGVAAVRDGDARLDHLFIAFRHYPVVIGITLLTTLIMAGIFVLVALPTFVAGAALGPAGMLLLIPLVIAGVVAAIYLSIRLWFAGLVAVDPSGPRPGVVDSIKLSWRMTRGPTALSLFGLGIVVGLIALASFLLLVLPALFFGGPLVVAVWGAAYATLAVERGAIGEGGGCTRCGHPNPGSGICPGCGHPAAPQPGGTFA